MAYSTGTINDANPGPVLLTALQTAMTGVGWVFVRDIVVTTNTYKVMKSPAAANSFGADFYVVLKVNTTGTGNITFAAMEVWDDTALLAQRYIPSTSPALPTSTFAFTDSTGVAVSSNALAYIAVCAYTASQAFSYYLTVTADRVIFAMRNGAADFGAYVGLYDSYLTTTDDPFPLCCVPMTTSGSTSNSPVSGGATREPRTTVNTTYAFGVFVSVNYLAGIYQPAEGYTGKPFWTKLLLTSSRGTQYWRGTLKDVLYGAVPSVTPVVGDTVTVNGVVYTKAGVGTIWMAQT